MTEGCSSIWRYEENTFCLEEKECDAYFILNPDITFFFFFQFCFRSVTETLEAELRESINSLDLLSSQKGAFDQQALPTLDSLTNQEIDIVSPQSLPTSYAIICSIFIFDDNLQ